MDLNLYGCTFRGLLLECLGGGLLFATLGFYLDQVMPTAIGGRKHPCFCFLPRSYSCCKKRSNVNLDDDSEDEERTESMLDSEKNTDFITRD